VGGLWFLFNLVGNLAYPEHYEWDALFYPAALFIASIAGFYLLNLPDKNETVEKTNNQKLVSLKCDTLIKGEVGRYVFSTMIKEQYVYSYYFLKDNGAYKQDYVPANRTEIFEEGTSDPRVEQYTTSIFYNKVRRILGCIFFFDSEDETYYSYKIYVPVGSVVKEISLK
jgi:hypothetical protein